LKRLALVFHLNQLTGPGVASAASASYRGLLETLREHPALPVHLHLSGTLLAGLPWYAPDVLDLVREGVSSGQFEILGSTYAQSIPESTPRACNDVQVAAHREILLATLGVRPVGFWNPERCYSLSYVELVARAGYRYLLLETGILEAARLPRDRISRVTVAEPGGTLHLVPDDPKFRACVNFSIWSGDCRPVMECLQQAPEGALLVHAEDAEAFGLWPFERGVSPACDREHLGRLIKLIEHTPDLEVVHLSSRIDAEREPDRAPATAPTVRGPGEWMVRALASSDLPYHEDGYRDWFDFNDRAEKLVRYRELFARVIGELAAIEAGLPAQLAPPARGLLDRARQAFAACQYEFGCTGIGHVGWPAWELIRSSLLLARAAGWAARRAAATGASDPPPEVADHDLDGVPEAFVQVGEELLVATPVGGRALAWIDLNRGEVLGGPALSPAMPGPMISVAHPFVGPVRLPARWDAARPARAVEVSSEKAWFAPLVAGCVPDTGRLRVRLRMFEQPPQPRRVHGMRRIGLFADEIDGTLATATLPMDVSPGAVRFTTPDGPKVLRLTRGSVIAEYPPAYGGSRPLTVRMELLPERATRPRIGGPPLRIDATDSALALELTTHPEAALLSWEEVPLAWVAGVTYATGDPERGRPGLVLELRRYPY
jgi:hypothetical protein